MKVFAYCRVSDESQKLGDGFPRQEVATKAYATANSMEIAETFYDDISGTVEGHNRPAWIAMIARAMAEDVTVILVECLNRLAREIVVQEHIIIDLKRRGIKLISVMEPYLAEDDEADPSRKLIRVMLGAIAEYDKSMIVLRLRKAKDRIRAREGKCEGPKHYGDKPGELDALALILACRSQGMTLTSICDHLTSEGVRPRRGRCWHAKTVQRILLRNQRVS